MCHCCSLQCAKSYSIASKSDDLQRPLPTSHTISTIIHHHKWGQICLMPILMRLARLPDRRLDWQYSHWSVRFAVTCATKAVFEIYSFVKLVEPTMASLSCKTNVFCDTLWQCIGMPSPHCSMVQCSCAKLNMVDIGPWMPEGGLPILQKALFSEQI